MVVGGGGLVAGGGALVVGGGVLVVVGGGPVVVGKVSPKSRALTNNRAFSFMVG